MNSSHLFQFVVVSFAAAEVLIWQEKSAKKAPLHHMHQISALGISLPSWNTSGQLANLYTPQCAWLLKRLVCAEGDLFLAQNTNCYRATILCFDAKGLGKPGFILAGFTLSLPCSAPCGTEQTTIDTGCDPALSHNRLSSSRLQLQNNKLIEFARNCLTSAPITLRKCCSTSLCCAVENHRQ